MDQKPRLETAPVTTFVGMSVSMSFAVRSIIGSGR